ncbi:MAG: UDP-N-acetylmuramate--L-alanine ligase [Candidatus Eremiobacteraeota bacterium]|nr:UDP-N-acetylmuramate--L-alanine ligase [Candidatus Eremiobacteraeota bacterium]
MERRDWHFVGIGGIGMSALARLLHARGHAVSGSDVSVSPLVDRLREEGIAVTIGHDAANVRLGATVVVSSAIDPRNSEYVAAQRTGATLMHRGELLAALVRERRGIAVCGTHGKTTTTAMVHSVLRHGGVDATLALGGIDGALNTNFQDGSSEWFVTEADESDGSFSLLEPEIAVVTNIENDHCKTDDELPQLVDAFGEFLGKLPPRGVAVVGADDPLAASLIERPRAAATHTFGFGARSNVRAEKVRREGLATVFSVIADGAVLGNVELRVPGSMNVANALAAIAVARALDIPFAFVAAGLRAFRGVRRRFDILARTERLVVVDDYAHHPTAVRATIAAARQCHNGPVIVAFQPHRYSRTAYLCGAFAEALRDADAVYLTPIYAASEAVIPGVSERSIGGPLSKLGTPVGYVADVAELEQRIYDRAPHGALVLMLGAGNISDAAARLARLVNGAAVRA